MFASLDVMILSRILHQQDESVMGTTPGPGSGAVMLRSGGMQPRCFLSSFRRSWAVTSPAWYQCRLR
jgi:hypothetical protein